MKKIVSLSLIIIMYGTLVQAQTPGDSTAYERRPFQFTFLFPPLSTNGVNNVLVNVGAPIFVITKCSTLLNPWKVLSGMFGKAHPSTINVERL